MTATTTTLNRWTKAMLGKLTTKVSHAIAADVCVERAIEAYSDLSKEDDGIEDFKEFLDGQRAVLREGILKMSDDEIAALENLFWCANQNASDAARIARKSERARHESLSLATAKPMVLTS